MNSQEQLPAPNACGKSRRLTVGYPFGAGTAFVATACRILLRWSTSHDAAIQMPVRTASRSFLRPTSQSDAPVSGVSIRNASSASSRFRRAVAENTIPVSTNVQGVLALFCETAPCMTHATD
jgi:hypothetical protein